MYLRTHEAPPQYVKHLIGQGLQAPSRRTGLGFGPFFAPSAAECPGYEPGEIAKSKTSEGHLTPDVRLLKDGRLLIADFGVNWRHVKPSTKKEKLLNDWLKTFETDPSYRLRILGYSDCVGEEKNNKILRSNRAEQIWQLLGKSAQKRVESKGPADLGTYVADNITTIGRAMNRGAIIELHRIPPSPPQPWEPMPQPEPKEYRLAPPRSVAEVIELLEYARDLARGHPPDLAGAQAAVSAADAWLYPLRDNIHRRFQPGGFFRFRRFIGLQEVQTAALLAGRGIEEVRSLKRKLALGSSVAWDSSINAVRFARYFLEVLADEVVSFELNDAPAYRPSLETAGSKKLGLSKSQVRVLAWLRKHKRTIVQAERIFRIDRRAVAGAIAWEALENPLFLPVRWIGPGKMHYKTGAFGGEDTVAMQVEDAGYLPTKRSQEERQKSLSTPSGAIMYIAASMKAAADIAWQEHGSDIYRDPGVLTWFYQSTDLKEWRQHLKSKRAKGERTFDVQKEPMARWVLDHLAFLELAVGKPDFVPKYPQRAADTSP